MQRALSLGEIVKSYRTPESLTKVRTEIGRWIATKKLKIYNYVCFLVAMYLK